MQGSTGALCLQYIESIMIIILLNTWHHVILCELLLQVMKLPFNMNHNTTSGGRRGGSRSQYNNDSRTIHLQTLQAFQDKR